MDWFEYHPRKWRASTRHLTPYQDGIYHRLVDEYMDTEEAFDDDDSLLAGIARISLEDFAPHAAIIRNFFKAKNGKLYHLFCEEVLNARGMRKHAKSLSASKAASIRWENERKKKQQNQELKCDPHENQMRQPCGTMPQTGQTEESKKKDSKPKSESESKPASPEKPPPDIYDKSPPKPYWWSLDVIKLNEADYNSWLELYGGTDEQFMAFLADRDLWLANQPPEKRKNWFISTKRHLEKMKENS